LHKTAVGVSGVKSAARELTCAPQNGEDERERERKSERKGGRGAEGKVEREVHGSRKEGCVFNARSFVLAAGLLHGCATISERTAEIRVLRRK